MKNIILFDDENWKNFLPLTYTRPTAELRLGIDKISEKWAYALAGKISYITKDHLTKKYPINIEVENILINGSVLPTRKLELLIKDLELNEAVLYNEDLIAARLDQKQFAKMIESNSMDEIRGIDVTNSEDAIIQISHITDLFSKNAEFIIKDFKRITAGRVSEPISSTNTILGKKEDVFIESGVNIECCILNAKNGPIYIGKNALVMEGSMLRGPLAVMEKAVIKMGAKIYGGTTIGPHCKAGGEINNSMLYAYSNKGHEGYLGNSILGEWCNLGADTNTSNLKNNYDEVKLWSYVKESFVKTGLTFCGLIMGDHSKSGINTMFNTGTVVGVSCNIFGDGFPRNFIPSFSWGGASGYKTYLLDQAIDTAKRVMERSNQTLEENDIEILQFILLESAKYRSWEKK